jgi:hypothetical protein
MKVIIAGNRTFHDKETVFGFINRSKFDITEVVSGHAEGVDKIGEEWAGQHNIPVKQYIPHYRVDNPKFAPLARNMDMGDYADALIAVWDGKSNGTRHMIEYMQNQKKPVELNIYKDTDPHDESSLRKI